MLRTQSLPKRTPSRTTNKSKQLSKSLQRARLQSKKLLRRSFSTQSSPPTLKTVSTTTTQQSTQSIPTPLVTTTVTDPGAITFESALDECITEVKRNAPYHAAQISLLPPSQRPLAYGLRALLTELDAIPEKATKADIIFLKASFWRSSADKMRTFIIHDMLLQQYTQDSPEMKSFYRQHPNHLDPPPPLAPIKTMSHAIAHEGLGFDFLQLDNMILNHCDYYEGHIFPDLQSYIQTVDQTLGNLNLLLITTGAHTLQNLQELQPLSKPIMNATIQLGRVEGLFRLLSQQPITFASNHTWLPRDLLRQNGCDPAHFVTAGKTLLEHSNKEWFEGYTKGLYADIKISANISHEFQDDGGEEELEKELHFLRSNDPDRKHEGLQSTIPEHLRDIQTITTKQLRTSLRETNKILYNITTEQLVKLRSMQKDIPKQLRPYFFQSYITETYLDALKDADYDTLDPNLHIWGPKQMLKLNAKMLWGNTISKY